MFATRHAPQWILAACISVLTGFLYWLLSNPLLLLPNHLPDLSLAWAPLAGLSLITYAYYLERNRRLLYSGLLLFLVTLYVFWQSQSHSSPNNDQYLILATLHLPLFTWAITAYSLLGWPTFASNRFGFILKSLSVFITAGLFMGVIGLFTAITAGLFSAINTVIPDAVARIIMFGGAGLIPLVAILLTYKLDTEPVKQDFRSGLDSLVTLIARLTLPFAVFVLAIYLVFIWFHFWAPFYTRNLLIIYNVTLAAVTLLIIAAASMEVVLSRRLQRYLRLGLLLIATLVLLVDLYALSATLFRTVHSTLTPNRFAIIGWDVLSAFVLGNYVLSLIRSPAAIIKPTHQVFGRALVIYAFWTSILILGVPLFFW